MIIKLLSWPMRDRISVKLPDNFGVKNNKDFTAIRSYLIKKNEIINKIASNIVAEKNAPIIEEFICDFEDERVGI